MQKNTIKIEQNTVTHEYSYGAQCYWAHKCRCVDQIRDVVLKSDNCFSSGKANVDHITYDTNYLVG